jgi:hypothetical protein
MISKCFEFKVNYPGFKENKKGAREKYPVI